MESLTQIDQFLEMIDRPAFFVQDGTVSKLNQIAKNRNIKAGLPISRLLPKTCPEYEELSDGFLNMRVYIDRIPCNATVIRYTNGDIFLLERDLDRIQRQTLSLAAQQLRLPLSNMFVVTDQLLPELSKSDDEKVRHQAAQINHSLMQMVRILANMADADRYTNDEFAYMHMELTNYPAFITQIMEKAAAMAEEANVTLNFNCSEKRMVGIADRDLLERGIYNMLSNAIKFTPKGSCVDVAVTKSGNRIKISIQDQGPGIASHVRGTLFSRYQREPAVEDSRYGLGLGMSLIHSAAAIHGGSVLIDQPEGCGTRVTMTLTVSKFDGDLLRTQTLPLSNYAGGMDIALMELSEVLPTDAYKNNF